MGNVTRLFDRLPYEAAAAAVPSPVVAGAVRAAAPTINVHARRFMGVAELAGRLGLGHHAHRTIVDKLRALHRQMGLPLPRNPRIVNGQVKTGADAICMASLWDRGEALAWIDHGSTPPPALGATEPPRARRDLTRATLADRAAAQLIAARKRRVGE